MPVETLKNAFVDELKDLLSAEKQITEALPKMAQKATSKGLKKAFEDHLEETQNHIERLEKAFESIDLKATSKKCEAMEGLLKEGKHVIEETDDAETLDAFMIAAAQKVEHYEIASYGTVCAWAECLGYKDAKRLLAETLQEEKDADSRLSDLSYAGINKSAMAA